VQGHRPFKTISEDETKSTRRAAREAAAAEPGTEQSKSGGRQMAIEELWKPSGVGIAFWEACGIE
jgi:translation initiation factor 2D